MRALEAEVVLEAAPVSHVYMFTCSSAKMRIVSIDEHTLPRFVPVPDKSNVNKGVVLFNGLVPKESCGNCYIIIC